MAVPTFPPLAARHQEPGIRPVVGPVSNVVVLPDGALGAVAISLCQERANLKQYVAKYEIDLVAWDILLTLYACTNLSPRLCTEQLIKAAVLPRTTGDRRIAALKVMGLLERKDGLTDRRICRVTLTSLGKEVVEGYLLSKER